MSSSTLTGLRVLVAEDESLIAMMLGDMLDALGCVVAAQFDTVAEASGALGRLEFDVAVLDMHLADGPALPLIDAVRARGLPVVLASGSGDVGFALPVTILPKPYTLPALEAALSTACLRPVT